MAAARGAASTALASLSTAAASPASALVSDASFAGVAEPESGATGSPGASLPALSGASELISPASEDLSAAESFVPATGAVLSTAPSADSAPSPGVAAATASAIPSAPSAHSCAGVVPKAIAKARNATRPRLATPRAIAPWRRHEARWHSSSNISICLLLSELGALPSGCPTSSRTLRSSTPIGVLLPSRAQRVPAACAAAARKMGGDPT